MTNDLEDDNKMDIEDDKNKPHQVEVDAQGKGKREVQEEGLAENFPVAKKKKNLDESVDDVFRECCPTLTPQEQEKLTKRLLKVMSRPRFQQDNIKVKKGYDEKCCWISDGYERDDNTKSTKCHDLNDQAKIGNKAKVNST
jgi:hypothetical protein